MLKLYSYYRSTASYRVRIALNYKKIPYELVCVDLPEKEQLGEAYQALNPHARVPTLVDGSLVIGQSLAILEYLEERYVDAPVLLPKAPEARALARYIAQIIVSDMHPLNNSGTLNFLKQAFQLRPEAINEWYHHWLKQGFDALEKILLAHPSGGKFCLGDAPSFADICLIPQIFNAKRFHFDMSAYPTLCRINDDCLSLPFFEAARPENQPDFQPRPDGIFP